MRTRERHDGRGLSTSVKNDLQMQIYRWCECLKDDPPSVFEQSKDSRQTVLYVVNRGRAEDHCNKDGRPDDVKMKAGLMGWSCLHTSTVDGTKQMVRVHGKVAVHLLSNSAPRKTGSRSIVNL